MKPVEIVSKIYEAYGRGDIEASLALCSEDVCFSWVAEPALIAFAGDCMGKSAFRQRLTALMEAYEYVSYQPVQIVDGGDIIAGQVRMELVRRDTGRQFTIRCADFWTVRDGAVVHMIEYYDTALAAEMEKPLGGG